MYEEVVKAALPLYWDDLADVCGVGRRAGRGQALALQGEAAAHSASKTTQSLQQLKPDYYMLYLVSSFCSCCCEAILSAGTATLKLLTDKSEPLQPAAGSTPSTAPVTTHNLPPPLLHTNRLNTRPGKALKVNKIRWSPPLPWNWNVAGGGFVWK